MANTAYTSGQFVFNLDDAPDATAWLKSVDGGAVKGSVVTESVGPDDLAFRHVSVLEMDPITLEVGLAAAKPILKWIQDSWNHKFSRRSGSIVHADFRNNAVLEQSFQDALIEEVTFPALDGSDKNAAYVTVKLHPEGLEIKKGNGKAIQGVEGANKEKLWLPSMFRVDIDGIDCKGVNKIDSISVKQKITKMYTGSNRYPELEPTGIEFPNVTLYMAAGFADGFIDWHSNYVVKGDQEPKQEKTGHIEFLDPTAGKPIFTIELKRVGINALSVEKSEANAESIKRVKVELYVDQMELKYEDGFE